MSKLLDTQKIGRVDRNIDKTIKNKSCLNCVHGTVCQGKRELKGISDWLPGSKENYEKVLHLFESLANCCMMYNINK